MPIEAGPDFHVAQALDNNDLSLSADAGESLLVDGLWVEGASGNYVTVTTGKTKTGYFRVGGTQGNHLFFPDSVLEVPNLFSLLRSRGIHRGFPVAEGETFKITGAAQAGARQMVTYRLGEAGDYTPTDPNGSQATDYDFINYGRVSGGAGDGDNLYDTSQTPVQFPAFPFGDLAPPGKVMTLAGIALSDYDNTTGTQANQQETQYLKAVVERETWWDEARDGLLCLGAAATGADESSVADDHSVLGNRSSVDLSSPLFLTPAIDFEAKEELNLYITTNLVAGSANFAAGDCEVGLIFRVSEGGGRR